MQSFGAQSSGLHDTIQKLWCKGLDPPKIKKSREIPGRDEVYTWHVPVTQEDAYPESLKMLRPLGSFMARVRLMHNKQMSLALKCVQSRRCYTAENLFILSSYLIFALEMKEA